MFSYFKSLVGRLKARYTCSKDTGEWTRHYCTRDCNTCGYNKYAKGK